MQPAGPVLGYLTVTLLFPISATPGADAKRESLTSSKATWTATAVSKNNNNSNSSNKIDDDDTIAAAVPSLADTRFPLQFVKFHQITNLQTSTRMNVSYCTIHLKSVAGCIWCGRGVKRDFQVFR